MTHSTDNCITRVYTAYKLGMEGDRDHHTAPIDIEIKCYFGLQPKKLKCNEFGRHLNLQICKYVYLTSLILYS